MYLEELINKPTFIHYLNLYNYYNLKLFYNSIITEVPFLEVDINKMLSFNGEKEYIKGTTSEQLQKYLKSKEYFYKEEKKISNYMEKRDKKYVSNSFYDKFFFYNKNNGQYLLEEYNKSISDNAYLGLYPFKLNPKEMIDSKVSLKNKQNIHFLLICEIEPTGIVKIKAFNENLLIQLLSNDNKIYKLKYNYHTKNKNLVEILDDLYHELNIGIFNKTTNFKKINKSSLIKEIDKLLNILDNNKENKKFNYQINNKINFLFYENENIVNNNLHNFYKNEFVDKFMYKKNIQNEEIQVNLENTLTNKNIIDFYFKMLNEDFNSIDKNIVFKFKDKLIYLNNLDNIKKEDIEDYLSIIYIINLIFKRLNIDLTYNTFIVGSDKKLKDYAFDISNINFDNKISDYINIDYKNNKFITRNKSSEIKVFNELINIIDHLDINLVTSLIKLKTYHTDYLDKDFFTYCPNYLKFLKEELNKNIYETEIKNKTFLEKIMSLFINLEEHSKNIIIDKEEYNKDILKNIKIENDGGMIKEKTLLTKENFFIDLSVFNNFTFNELKGLYLKSVLKINYNDTIINLLKKENRKNVENIFPIQFGKSNIIIDYFKNYNNIDNIIIDKPDNIPLYYIFPMLYNSSYVFTHNNEYNRKSTGYWVGYNPKILNSHATFIKERISSYLKINDIFEEEIQDLQYISNNINFKNFTNKAQLMSIKEYLNKDY